MEKILLVLLFIVILLFVLCLHLWRKLRETAFFKRSLSSRYGKMTEQFMPFLAEYPYDPGNFRFLGSPIDGIQFEDDKIVFVEFKSANSQLGEKQKRIAELIRRKKVEFQEHRIE